jgi:hypothetical protein
MVMYKRGGSEFFKIQVINRRGKAITPERTADTMTLFQNMLNHIKELAKTYKEGKLYETIKITRQTTLRCLKKIIRIVNKLSQRPTIEKTKNSPSLKGRCH